MGLAQFLARSRWGTQWGVVDAQHPNGHRGHDIKLVAREAVLCIRSGTVYKLDQAGELGFYTVILTAFGWDYYCHQYGPSRIAAGTKVVAGQQIGVAAGPRDTHGSAWSGPHLHYGSGPYPTSVVSGATYNATAIVEGVMGSLASVGPVTPLPTKDLDMSLSIVKLVKDDLTTSAGIWLQNLDTGLRVQIQDTAHIDWIQRVIKADNDDTLAESQLNTVAFYIGQTVPKVASPAPGGGGVPADYFSDGDAAALLQAIQNGEAANLAALLAAIAQVDENTLATFGLKRA